MLYVKDFLKDQTIFSAQHRPAPKVSVILPTYQRYRDGFLERSMMSVLSQDFDDFELLVMDDGSRDGSSDFIETMRSRDERIIHVRHEQNCGLPALRVNEGIELAKGQYLAFQFDDDVWRKNTLKDLLSEAEQHEEPVVVVGRSQFTTRLGRHVYPLVPIHRVTLTEDNRFANNSVLFRRSLVQKFGLYDPHIGMRRLCDWDLWLRMIPHLPFIVIDQIVSDVYESNEGAIGVTVPWDLPLFRYLHSIPRSELLSLERWRDYSVDALHIGDVEICGDIRRRLYEQQVVPYYFKFRHAFPDLGSFTATHAADGVKTLCYTKQAYDVSNDVTIGHYENLLQQRGSYQTFYQQLDQVNQQWEKEIDVLLLMRTVEDRALELSRQAVERQRACGLYLDDDLLHFHEYGPQFGYLAPGTPYHQNLVQIMRQVDAVLVTNDYIGESAAPYNPRILPHNNTIPAQVLPDQVHPRHADVLRIGYVGSGYRIEEFRHIWEALLLISRQFKDRLSFEFWGLDVSSLPVLASPVIQKPFTFSYQYYLEQLKQAQFDILLTPMLEQPRPRLGKSLIKYYETAAAGALGIFSDVPQYMRLPAGLTCLKAENTSESWYKAIQKAVEMAPREFDAMRQRCLEHVREEYSASAQVDLHEAALRAIEFHHLTRDQRHEDGLPRVMYVLHSVHYGGAEIQLHRRLHLAKKYGIMPVVVLPGVLRDSEPGLQLRRSLEQSGIEWDAADYVCFTEPRSPAEYFSDYEHNSIRQLLERHKPALVHTVTFIPTIGQVCQEMGIPHVSTLYAVDDQFAWPDGAPGFTHCQVVQSDCLRYATRWSQLLGGTPKICARDNAPEELFWVGQRRRLEAIGETPLATVSTPPVLVSTGTFQERKQQLETIEAAGRLKQDGFTFKLVFYGYTHFFPDYMARCRDAIRAWNLQEEVEIHEFTEDIARALEPADILLSLSTYESFPGSIKDAFAAGVMVVATPVGGIRELVVNGVSGIVCNGTSVEALADGLRQALKMTPSEREKIAEQGRRIARLELHPYRTANDLFRMYNLALESRSARAHAISVAAASTAAAPGSEQASTLRAPVPQVGAAVRSPSTPPGSTLRVGPGVVYAFTPERNLWTGLDLLVGTHMRSASGELVLKVRSSQGNILRQASLDLSKARDNDWIELRFAPLRNVQNKPLLLEFSVHNPGPDTIISLYQGAPLPHRSVHIFKRALQALGIHLQGHQLYCREWYR